MKKLLFLCVLGLPLAVSGDDSLPGYAQAVCTVEGKTFTCDICGDMWTEWDDSYNAVILPATGLTLDHSRSIEPVRTCGLALCAHCRDAYSKEIQATMDKLVQDLKQREKSRIEAREKQERARQIREYTEQVKKLTEKLEALKKGMKP